MTKKLTDYYINTLTNSDRYGNGFNPGELQHTDSSIDELMYELDGTPADVEDDVKERDGQYENSAAFMSDFLDQNLFSADKVHDEEEIYGFIATKPREGESFTVGTDQAVLQRTPLEVALVFEVAGEQQYDIKIE
jgi:hypothetical protein